MKERVKIWFDRQNWTIDTCVTLAYWGWWWECFRLRLVLGKYKGKKIEKKSEKK